MRFEGTESYVADNDLKIAVNAAIALERPLLIKGETANAENVMAEDISQAIGAPLIEFNKTSATKEIHPLND
jgi:MoxR-like ATPase